VQQAGGLRGFVQRPVGRALLLAFAILITFATYVYLSTLLAIPVILLVGLAVPIWLGLKRLRVLAIFGFVILLVVAPLATVVITQDVRTPIGPASSSGYPGFSGPVMSNATVSPYVGTASTNFTWTVTINPAYIPKNTSSPLWLNLYLSTCPGATASNDTNCNAGYPFWVLNYTFPGPLAGPTPVQFHFAFGSEAIWAWQMGLYLQNYSANGTSRPFTFVVLTGDPVYNGLEGPVTGDFASTYTLLVLTVYLNDFIYLGIPYFVVLLLYSYITRRRASRADQMRRAAGPTPGDAAGPPRNAPISTDRPVTAPSAPSAGSRRPEMNCPNCNAVVYPNETKCWKCGAALSSPSSSPPLPSGPPPK
jgi:hypothetical protein